MSNLSCSECQARLPQVVEAQLGGRESEVWDSIQSHLRGCQACRFEYVWLIKIGALEANGQLAWPESLPALETSFLARRSGLHG